jgi:hypothetical protein
LSDEVLAASQIGRMVSMRIEAWGGAVDNERSELRWGGEQRLEFIEFRLSWKGQVNRSDLMDQFGLSQASTDLERYIGIAPTNMVYDKGARTSPRTFGNAGKGDRARLRHPRQREDQGAARAALLCAQASRARYRSRERKPQAQKAVLLKLRGPWVRGTICLWFQTGGEFSTRHWPARSF